MTSQARRTNASTSSDGPAKKIPSVPRPSASLLLVNKNDEVLMIQRTLATKHFAGLHAFPGGNFDPKQDADFRMTALRETLEETGILLVEQPTTNATNATNATAEQLAAARLAIHSRTDPLTFPDFLARYHLQPPVDKLVPFSQWITPEDVPVRFHARFYVLFTEELDLQGAVVEQVQPPTSEDGGGVRVQNPTADGGVEIISASWIHPRDLFAAFRKGELSLFPPQYYLLTTLGNLLDSMPQGSNRTEALRRYVDGFGSRLFNPRPTGFTEEGGKGQRAILTYEGDELRGGNVGDRHRSLVLYQGRRIADIELQRNIDVLTPLDRSESKARL